jgi:DNA-binding winged helix-turn-helix (wHTH) protein
MRDAAGSPPVEPSRQAVRFADLILDIEGCRLTRDSGEAIPLTRGELALLRMFVSRPGRVISRDNLLDAFTRRRFEPFDRSVDVLIGKLRRKIEPDPKQPRLIVTVTGEGYRFDGLTQSLLSRLPDVDPASEESLRLENDSPLAEARPATQAEQPWAFRRRDRRKQQGMAAGEQGILGLVAAVVRRAAQGGAAGGVGVATAQNARATTPR